MEKHENDRVEWRAFIAERIAPCFNADYKPSEIPSIPPLFSKIKGISVDEAKQNVLLVEY